MKSIFQKVFDELSGFFPSFLGALALIVAGLIAGWIIRIILTGILKKAGLDKLSKKSGAEKLLSAWGMKKTVSEFIGKFVYWVVVLLFLLAAAETIGLNIVADIFKSLLDYLPNILASVLILLIGGFFSGLAGDAARVIAENSSIRGNVFIGQFVKYSLLVFVIILAIQKLDVDTMLLSAVVITVFVSVAITLAIAFGSGTRELARNIIAGFHARETFSIGTTMKVGNHSGKLIRIGTYKFILENGNERISLPNHLLTEDEVIITSEVN